MTENNIAVAEAFYKAFNDKDVSGIASCLHNDVQFLAPLGQLSGKEAVIEATKRPFGILKSIKIRAKFTSGDQVVLIYDMYYGENSAVCPTAVLMNIKDSLIIRLELFYDARPFGNL